MTEINPSMITLAREARGMTQADLARAAKVSPSKVSKYEAGALQVSARDASVLADVLEYPLDFFQDRFARAAETSHIFHHRKKARLTMSKTREIHARADACRLHIARVLTDIDVDTTGFTSMDVDAFDGDVERIATLVRASWRVAPGPIPNLVEAVERAGAVVVAADFGTRDLDAVSQYDPHLPPVIFLNRAMPADRQRLTLAHEVGHLIMHRIPVSPDPEKEANQFAGAFLLPEREFRAEVGSRVDLKKLLAMKPRWKVSVQAMVVRAKTLGMISDRQYRSLFMRMGAMGWRTNEPLPLQPERPSMMRRITEIHATEHGLSLTDVSRMARIREDEFRSLFLGDGTRLHVLRPARGGQRAPSPQDKR